MRIAAIGDVHGEFDGADAAWLDGAGLDLVLFVGDLPGVLHTDLLSVAREVARLRTPALLVPGNHDATGPLQMLLDQGGAAWLDRGSAGRQARRLHQLSEALSPVRLCAFSAHPVGEIVVIAARPHGMDGRRLAFSPYLARAHGVRSLDDSAARLCALVDDLPSGTTVLFLAHNGPAGLGSGPTAPWASGGRDLGDPDLATAIAHARERGLRVAAVVAGHVHHRGAASARRWCVVRDGTSYVNCARTPRWERGRRFYVELAIDAGRAAAVERSYRSG